MINLIGMTQRDRYRCDQFTLICITLHRLAITARWFDIEMVYSLLTKRMSEIHWEVVSQLV